MKINTVLTTGLMTLAIVSFLQIVQAQEIRKISKIGLYLLDPLKGTLPPQVQFSQSIPPITLESEKEIFPHLSLGTEFGGAKMDITVDGIPSSRSESVPFRQSIISVWGSIKGVIHFDLTDRIEAYGSFGVGYFKAFSSSNNDDYNSAVSSLGLSQFSGITKYIAVGTNVFISEHFGVYGEAGIKEAKGTFKIGLVFRN